MAMSPVRSTSRFVAFLLPSSLLLSTLSAQRPADEALAALRAGNARFVQDKSRAQTTDPTARQLLAQGQHPFAIVLTCADSRVAPEHVFDTGMGELFVIRVAGNVCDPEVLASIEYAAQHLDVRLAVVLGHEGCGAVKACAQQGNAHGGALGSQHLGGHGASSAAPDASRGGASPALTSLLRRIDPAVQRAKLSKTGNLLVSAEEENVYQTIGECVRQSATLRRLLADRKFKLVPARYRLLTGAIEWLPERPHAGASLASERRPRRTPHEALQQLQDGHRRFRSASTPLGDVSLERRRQLRAGQKPTAVIVTCADSRVAPELLFDAGLGEVFVIRVAGNVLNDSVQASIEYAVEHTGAPLVMVLGHSRCGAVTVAAGAGGHESDLGPNLRQLVARMTPAVEKARAEHFDGDALVERAIELNVLAVMAELSGKSEIVQRLVGTGQLAMVGAVYQLDSGDLKWLEAEEPSAAAPPATPPARHGHSGR